LWYGSTVLRQLRIYLTSVTWWSRPSFFSFYFSVLYCICVYSIQNGWTGLGTAI